MSAEFLYTTGRLALAGVLVLAVVPKLRDAGAFRAALASYRLLPLTYVSVAATLVIAVEIVAAATLVADVPQGLGAGIAALLFGVFSIALLVNAIRRRAVPCHCFGASEAEVIGWTTTIRTIVLTLLALGLVAAGAADRAWPPGGELVAAVAIAAGFVLAVRLSGFLPDAWSYLREPPPSAPQQPYYVSLRRKPLSTSFGDLFVLRAEQSGAER